MLCKTLNFFSHYKFKIKQKIVPLKSFQFHPIEPTQIDLYLKLKELKAYSFKLTYIRQSLYLRRPHRVFPSDFWRTVGRARGSFSRLLLPFQPAVLTFTGRHHGNDTANNGPGAN